MSPFTVLVEGNIGSGKTSLINFFKDKFPTRLFALSEPISKWRNCQGVNLFSLLAQDPKKYAFAFQQYVQLTMTDVHFCPPDEGQDVKIIERSLLSARHCFVENLYRSGIMSHAEYIVYQEWFQYLIRDLPKIDLILYLKATPEICLERIESRNRDEEKRIPLEYLQNLDLLHDTWLLHGTGNPPVLTIPAEKDKVELAAIFEAITPFVMGEKQWAGNEKLDFLNGNPSFTKPAIREPLSSTSRNIVIS